MISVTVLGTPGTSASGNQRHGFYAQSMRVYVYFDYIFSQRRSDSGSL